MNSAERRRLLRELERQGFEVELSGAGHFKARRNGSMVVFANTPSDHRGIRNAMRYLEAAGFDPTGLHKGKRRKPRQGGTS